MAGAGQYRAGRPFLYAAQLTTLTFAGFHPHLPSLLHRGLAKTLGAGMWFFIFYRAR
jgi:hypothetical protein